jgi:hypothetical protein
MTAHTPRPNDGEIQPAGHEGGVKAIIATRCYLVTKPSVRRASAKPAFMADDAIRTPPIPLCMPG